MLWGFQKTDKVKINEESAGPLILIFDLDRGRYFLLLELDISLAIKMKM